MGSDTSGQDDDEKPVHTVYLAQYSIAKYETTNAQYVECVNAGKCTVPKCDEYKKSGKANHPVVCIDWTQAKSYCEFAGKRLPTEAEWEKAARGTDGRTYPWGNQPITKELANYWASKIMDTTPVGSYPSGASPFGVLDMAGNVCEWTSSDNKAYPYIANDGRESNDIIGNNSKVFRSGAWSSGPDFTRAANREYFNTTSKSNYVGSRCAQ